MWEEAGVTVWDVRYHSGQPWVSSSHVMGRKFSPMYMQPYPANLMVGFYCRADAAQPIRIDLDNELLGEYMHRTLLNSQQNALSDARWFTRSEVKSVLNHQNRSFTNPESAKMNEGNPLHSNRNEIVSGSEEPPFKFPPVTAIAGVLIKDWADGKIDLSTNSRFKGSL